jgi:hypothetical protein
MGAAVSRHVLGLFLMLALQGPSAQAAPPTPAAIAVTFAENPPRLVRDKGFYRAGRGLVLRANDMLESGAGALQLGAGGTTIALGPASKVFISSGSELVLLDGWLKLRADAQQPFTVAAHKLRLSGAGTTVTLHAAPEVIELFAESGDVLVEEPGAGKAGRGTKVPHERFAVRAGALPLRLAARPPAAFLAAMPPGFRDETVALAAPAPAAPKLERAATFAELSPWLADHPSLRRQLQARFEPPRPPRRATPDLKATP